METDGDQQRASTNGSATSSTSSRPSTMNSMSLYERQAVQALQALQRQPNAAQYFQQLMLQQQINSAQLQNLAAVQQVKATLAASRQSSPSSSSSTQTTSSTSASVTSGSSSAPSSSRPISASATSTISQSVLFSGAAGGQGQMYLRVNRSLRAPISPQLIFMPSSTATAAVATVTQQPPPQQQNQEVTPNASGGAQDTEQAQNLAIRSTPAKSVGVKTEAPDKTPFTLVQPSHQSTPQSPSKPTLPQSHIKIPTYPAPSSLKAQPVSTSSGSIPLSQLLLHGPRTLTSSAPTAAHILVQTSSSQTHGYQVGTATIKPAVNAQTLVVQPLQKSSLGDGPHLLSAQLHSRPPLQKGSAGSDKSGNGPVPIQPKTLQGLRLPLQLPSRNPPPILPAPPASTSSSSQAPHIPVQIVGARPSTLGSAQALALARNNCGQDVTPVLSSSSSLLTMVASIASRENAGVIGRGVGLKALQSLHEAPVLAPQVSQVHPQTNQSGQNGHVTASPAPSSQPSHAVSPSSRSSRATDDQRAVAHGDSVRNHGTQGKQLSNSLKRKSDSNSAHDEDGPSPPRLQPVKDHNSTLPTSHNETASVSPPHGSVSPVLSVSRGCGHSERGPPPQAVVKPNVLTHLIEGFVIQEGAEPFPVSAVCGPVKDSSGEELANDVLENNKSETTASVLKCEYCKNFAPESQFRGTKRFCSMSCAKRYNVSFRQHPSSRHTRPDPNQERPKDQDRERDQERPRDRGERLHSEDEGAAVRRRVPRRTSSEIASAKIAGRAAQDKCGSESSRSEESSADEDEDDPMSLSPASSASCHQVPPPQQALPPPTQASPSAPAPPSAPSCPLSSPGQWSVQEVSQFISSLQGCEDLASQFLSQEIDGQALLLLKEEHLMSTMNIKLGPALKICAHINNLRD